jgi:hypothetical protein
MGSEHVRVELLKDFVLVTDGCYSIGIMVYDNKWSWDHWLRHGKHGWNQIPSEEKMAR